ncbi:MAG: biotin--[acetyl-CoA-carboxylase] ligase [Candidatus Saccharimonadaceae bacterium]
MEQLSEDRVVISMDETSSTNTELKQLQKQKPLPEGSIVMVDFQTHGRGQAGNTWYSGKGNNLLFSFLLYPRCVMAKDQFIISRIVSLALKNMLDTYLDGVTIKWPNDIYWNNKKIAGMLIENSLMGQQIDFTIIGIGLNVNEIEFPVELPNPVSMKQITGIDFDREEVLTMFFREFFILYRALQIGEVDSIEHEYMQYLFRKDNDYWFEDNDGRFRGTIKNVLSSGHLVIDAYPEKKERMYAFKEVAFVVESEQDSTK